MSEMTLSLAREVDILLVEDNPYGSELTLRGLKRYRPAARIVWSKDGESALYFFFTSSFDPAPPPDHCAGKGFLDLKLPKPDGHEVLRRLKEDPRTRVASVVLLSSSPQDADVEPSYLLGVNSYVVKPLEFDKFVESVGQLGRYWPRINQSLEKCSLR